MPENTRSSELEESLQNVANHLYSLSDDCPDEIAMAVALLRQLINEEYLHKGKTVGSQFIWDILKPAIEALIASKVREARIDELKQIEPPEQYEEYAKLLGHEACNICGFNAVKFRKYIQERIAALQSREQDKV